MEDKERTRLCTKWIRSKCVSFEDDSTNHVSCPYKNGKPVDISHLGDLELQNATSASEDVSIQLWSPYPTILSLHWPSQFSASSFMFQWYPFYLVWPMVTLNQPSIFSASEDLSTHQVSLPYDTRCRIDLKDPGSWHRVSPIHSYLVLSGPIRTESPSPGLAAPHTDRQFRNKV